MKIACQSCAAKYTIADEKVVGKIVKIRCKKCGATIVINGNEQASQPEQASAAPEGVFDYTAQGSGGEPWTVNVADEDQRTMTVDEIVAQYRAGVVLDDTFCWKDGMTDWLPLHDVPELFAACSLGPRPSLKPEGLHDSVGGQSPLFGGAMAAPAVSSTRDVAPVAAAPQSARNVVPLAAPSEPKGNGAAQPLFAPSANSPSPVAARRAGGRAGGDLFGTVEQAGGEDDVMTSAPAKPDQAPLGDQKMTGQRNENSVLFSLSTLTQNAPEPGKPGAAAAVEGSGLIDIRALASNIGEQKSEGRGADDIMNLAGGGAFAAPLAAPVLAPPPVDAVDLSGAAADRPGSSKTLIFSILGGSAVIAAAIVAAVFLTKKPDPVAVVTPSATVTQAGPGPTQSGPTATAETTQPAVSTAAAPSSAVAAPPTGAAAVTNRTSAPPTAKTGQAPTAATPGPATPPPTPTAATTGGGGGSGSLDDAMRRAVPTSKEPKPEPPTSSDKPFDRGAAAAALGSAAGSVQSCKKPDGPTGPGHVRVTFSPGGAVSSVDVDAAPYAGTGVGGCVAGRFRGARVPAFSGGSVTVGKSFNIN